VLVTTANGDLRSARARRRRQKLGSIAPNELIVEDLARFLERHRGGAVLDLGAGRKPFAPLYEPHFDRSVALDIDDSRGGIGEGDVVASADAIPFADEEFRAVICTEVLEHCRDPLGVLREIRRVLEPGGSAIVTTPFMLGLHEAPHDYYRYTPWALRDLADQAGLDVESLEPRGDWLGLALEVALWPISKVLSRTPFYRYGNPVVWLLVVAPQLAYLAYWRSGRRVRPWGNTPLGFTTIVRRRG
jgi:SAM-dependent methyltransferase